MPIGSIGDSSAAESMLDALERETGKVAERNSTGRRYVFAGAETVEDAAAVLAAALGRVAPGWQSHLVFEL